MFWVKLLRIILLGTFFGIALPQQVFLPEINNQDDIIEHFAYTLNYSEKHEQATWVAYTLTSLHAMGNIDRTDDFRPDVKVNTGSASLSDYEGTGYDRGHLAPAGDMKWSYEAMSESFYMSNMSPQVPGFNRGVWMKLESTVRNWAIDNGEINIVTGPVLTEEYRTIGSNQVSIPKYYYKVILYYSELEIKGIGFILPNQKSSKPLESYAVTIDEVEYRTGIDFYPSLPDKIELQIESSINVSKWSFRVGKWND